MIAARSSGVVSAWRPVLGTVTAPLLLAVLSLWSLGAHVDLQPTEQLRAHGPAMSSMPWAPGHLPACSTKRPGAESISRHRSHHNGPLAHPGTLISLPSPCAQPVVPDADGPEVALLGRPTATGRAPPVVS